MTASRNATENLTDKIHHHGSSDTDLRDVSSSLIDLHAHRPGMWQNDLKLANQSLHAQGLLPGLDIVGTRGQDLVVRDSNGQTQLLDSQNTPQQLEA
jgi:hypothetical protein